MNSVDAYIDKVKEGDVVEIKSKNGVVRVRAKISKNIREGVVFLPMHWGKQLQNDLNRANNLTFTRLDPQSKEPDFKYTTVSVKKYKKPQEKIVVIGAGAAAFRFIQNYREHNEQDPIHVFSKEPYPFYNRVLLPEYVTEELTWEQLQKIKEQELKKLKINLHIGLSIDKIDPIKQLVLDSEGNEYPFDKLIMATGSRAFVPKDAQLDLPGRFTMRNKTDADRFKEYLNSTNLAPETNT
ncbi:molybdopterin dinucleotide binding domain-containing protein [Algoriphagus halophilus]|uniref:molybdopterin dinucleotide binding domain-containing protein n=1 Tax=Algoriphagus halophilus TaxID=226505 RepID=UPI00358FEBE9